MASIKIIHYTHKVYSDGTSPIILQIISGKTTKRKVIFSVMPDQWNDKTKRVKNNHPNYKSINLNLTEKFNEGEKMLLEDGDIDSLLSKKQATLTFWEIANEYLEARKQMSGETYKTFNTCIVRFKEYINNDQLLLSKINGKQIHGFIEYLRKIGNQENSINLKLRVIRFVSNYAKSKGYDTQPEALHNFKLPSRASSGVKTKLLPDEIIKFSQVELTPGSKIYEIRDMFMLSVYLRGVRISDIIKLKQSYIRDGRIIYESGKNAKAFDIKLIPPAIEITNRYKDKREYLFSFYNYVENPLLSSADNNVKRTEHTRSITANINNKLAKIAEKAGITKKVSTHIARHTFARMALEKIKDTNITMDLLGHSSMKVHEIYLREISKDDDLDAAADMIFG